MFNRKIVNESWFFIWIVVGMCEVKISDDHSVVRREIFVIYAELRFFKRNIIDILQIVR